MRVVHAQILCPGKMESPNSVEILVDGAMRLPCALTNRSADKCSYEARLPESLFDGLPHSYEIIANDVNCSSTAYVDILNPVVTPEEHLTDSMGQAGYIGLSRNAGYRYESLALGLSEAPVSYTHLTLPTIYSV